MGFKEWITRITRNPTLTAGQITPLKGWITHRRIPILYYKPDLKQIDQEFEKILIVELAQDTGNRRRYADSLWYLVVSWLSGIAIILAVEGIFHLRDPTKDFLSEKVILALIGGTTASVLALFTIVAKFLFPEKEDLFGTVASKLSLTGATGAAATGATGAAGSKDPQPEHRSETAG
jgi:hypothetical protein